MNIKILEVVTPPSIYHNYSMLYEIVGHRKTYDAIPMESSIMRLELELK